MERIDIESEIRVRQIVSEEFEGNYLRIEFDREIDISQFKFCIINGEKYRFANDLSPINYVHICSDKKTLAEQIVFSEE